MKFLKINNEKILIITLFGNNRSNTVLDWHKKIMVDHFGLPINYVECPFPGVSHGYCMNNIISQTLDSENRPDYYWFIDNDMIFLKESSIEFIYRMTSNKMTVFGQAWMNNHQPKPRGIVHAYASQAGLMFSSDLYDKIGRPNCDHGGRSDTAEEITYAVKEKGYCVSLLYPNRVIDPNTNLDASCYQGFGNFYGQDMMFHCSQANRPDHEKLFVDIANCVLKGQYV